MNDMGIIQPNLRHNFAVHFLTSDGSPMDCSNDLAKQVIAVDSITHHGFGILQSNKTTITFEDDVLNRALKALVDLNSIDSFNVGIDTLDSNGKTTRSTVLKKSCVQSIKHSDLDYAAVSYSSTASMSIKMPYHMGPLIDEIKEDPRANAVLTALSGSQVNIDFDKKPKDAFSKIFVTLYYQDVEYKFPDQKSTD